LVGLITGQQDERQVAEYLDELEFLADTAGAEVYERFTQNSTTRIRQLSLAQASWPRFATLPKFTKSTR
jgi:hypothetical protein